MTDKFGFTIRVGDWVYPCLTFSEYMNPQQTQITEQDNGVLMLGENPLRNYHNGLETYAVIRVPNGCELGSKPQTPPAQGINPRQHPIGTRVWCRLREPMEVSSRFVVAYSPNEKAVRLAPEFNLQYAGWYEAARVEVIDSEKQPSKPE